ncbi:FeoA family protein [Halothiobacillus diazotrophicus]|uniref:FeoA family protein n=1 Tax=Halothiobacillus diazotrophicus TaxID=1860122 RepID=UPI000AC5FF47|nr:FeoA family protein [Halothiobacillus diazotrophicus]
MSDAIHLTMLKAAERGIVRGFAPGDAHYRRRLMAMGLTPGTAFTVTRLAPLGDPIQIEVRNSALTLRKDEAMMLRIDRLA